MLLAALLRKGYKCKVKSSIRVASPPAKPLLVFDGDCGFCTLWVRRWQASTQDRVDYVPSQDPAFRERYPEIPQEAFLSAVQLIETDGSVWSGAEAVLRGMSWAPHGRWLLELYEHSPAFARAADLVYGYVATHRTGFSRLTRWLWGRHVEPPSLALTRQLFLRCLGVVYLIAFVSLWVQISGLIGHNGIVPVGETMRQAHDQLDALHIGIDRFRLLPTLCWWNASDTFLNLQCAAGTFFSVLVILGLTQAPCLFLLWLVYLSLTTVGSVFLAFQWDSLLLETGFLAIFLAPLQWLAANPRREPPPSRLVVWLLRWLLFRLMFESGCVKLLSGDPTWRNLSALHYHFETQPLPTWIGWYASQLSPIVQKGLTAVMFVIELVVPLLFFLPRRPRMAAAVITVAFQTVIFLTGNYGFFNFLTAALCLLLLDDAALKWIAKKFRLRPVRAQTAELPCPMRAGQNWRWPSAFTWPVAAVLLATSLVQLAETFRIPLPGPRPVLAIAQWLQPFRSVNHYGLFSIMTTTRPEIILEGSYDGSNWQPYRFKYKPGDLYRRPRFVEPHQPRLDWQMWFAALGDVRENPWLVNLCVRLLQGSPEVLDLLATNPFPTAPPRYIRAELYEYRFTDLNTRRQSGNWWMREDRGPYLPPLSLKDDQLQVEGKSPQASAR